MTDGKLRTPDGRVIRTGAGEEPTGGELSDNGLGTMQPFIDACSAALPERPSSAAGRLGFFLFLLGAADRFWYRQGLDDRRFPAFAARLLQSQGGIAASEAVTIAGALPQLRSVAAARAVIAEGASMMDLWLDSHDLTAVLRITELLPHWEDMPDLLPGRS